MAEVLYMSIKDYAKHVSASVGTIYDMCRKGKLPAVKIGGWRINVKRADELLEQMCEENKTCQRFAGAVMEIWEKEEGKGYAKD